MLIKNKRYKIYPIIFILMITVIALTACAPFGLDAPQGISADSRVFKKIGDKRMVAEAENYKGYIYKSGDQIMTFRFKSPKNVQANSKYPLVVFFHGSGDGGTDNSSHMFRSLIESVDKYVNEDCYVLMPQANKDYDWGRGELWKGLKGGMSDIYNECLDELIGIHNIDINRIYITGMSMGGHGAMYQAYNYPDKYAAVVPLCGIFPDNEFADLSKLNDMGIWIAHSRTDNVVSFAESERLYNRLTDSGRQDIRTTWIDKYNHDITVPTYDNAELWEWLFQFNISKSD